MLVLQEVFQLFLQLLLLVEDQVQEGLEDRVVVEHIMELEQVEIHPLLLLLKVILGAVVLMIIHHQVMETILEELEEVLLQLVLVLQLHHLLELLEELELV